MVSTITAVRSIEKANVAQTNQDTKLSVTLGRLIMHDDYDVSSETSRMTILRTMRRGEVRDGVLALAPAGVALYYAVVASTVAQGTEAMVAFALAIGFSIAKISGFEHAQDEAERASHRTLGYVKELQFGAKVRAFAVKTSAAVSLTYLAATQLVPADIMTRAYGTGAAILAAASVLYMPFNARNKRRADNIANSIMTTDQVAQRVPAK